MPDERIARWAARGSEAAFAVIFERHHQALHRYCHTIVGNGHDASDALQSTMLKAFRALPGETRDIALRPWLYRIAHNESISLLRARRSDRELTAAAHLGDPAAAGIVESRDRMRALAADLIELTEQQRGALLMRELGGLSFAEIASALLISAAAAKQTVYESRCVLQALQEGREMECDVVRRTLSDGDRRALRGKRLRGHLRACTGCHDFERALHARPAELAALAPPLPMGAAAVMLQGLIGGGGGFGTGGGLIAVLTGSAKGVAGASLASQVATVAVVGSVVAGGGAVAAMPERFLSPTTPLLSAPVVAPTTAAQLIAGLGGSPASAAALMGEQSPAPAVPFMSGPMTAPAAAPATQAVPAAAGVTDTPAAAHADHGAADPVAGEASHATPPAAEYGQQPVDLGTGVAPLVAATPAASPVPAAEVMPAVPAVPAAADTGRLESVATQDTTTTGEAALAPAVTTPASAADGHTDELSPLSAPPADEPVQASGPSADGPAHASGPPAEKPAQASGPPAGKAAQASGPPADKRVQASGPPADKPAQATGPPADKPAQATGPPADKPAQATGPPADKPAQATGPPADKPVHASGPPADKPAAPGLEKAAEANSTPAAKGTPATPEPPAAAAAETGRPATAGRPEAPAAAKGAPRTSP